MGCDVIVGRATAGEPANHDALATASSEWGKGYGADAASDGIADENGNYWQTAKGKDQGAWWQVDLHETLPVQGLIIAWARYQDKYHCPPARAIVQVSSTAQPGSWKDVRTIEPKEIPRDGAAYEPGRRWHYPLTESPRARYVRLLFPDGGQSQAHYPGYLCLGEIEVQAQGLTPKIIVLEGAFGRADVNVSRPALVHLYLRGPGGLEKQSLLAERGRRPWARGGYTYMVGVNGDRYESRRAPPRHVELAESDGRRVLRILGIKLAASADAAPVATEDWTLWAPDDGSRLVWKIERRWEQDLTWLCSGSPGLFFSFDARLLKNSTTSTIWYDPLYIDAQPSESYALTRQPRRISENHIQTIRDRDAWAVYKLWTNWDAHFDLRLDVSGAHLYRRGSFSWLSEAGAVTGTAHRETRRRGQVEETMLRLSGADKRTTGYQLAVTLPDREMENALKDFYGSVLNGGAVNDQKGFDFGNQSDGWYYAGSSWMYGAALAAGVPAAGQLSSRPYAAAQAFREHLAHILSTLDNHGRARFGYNQGGEWVDDNLHTIIGTHSYLVHSGDLAFVRQQLPSLERMLEYFTQRRNDQGLFKLDQVGAHWYYDAIKTGGVNTYYNVFFYKAAIDLAAMEEAAGRLDQARTLRDLAESIKAAVNRLLWAEDAPGGPRYVDWIDARGQKTSYFCDLCQWPAIAVGVASPDQARKIVATADARIAALEKEHGYQGCASLSALWPVPQSVNPAKWQTFGRYMNGGSLLCQTYWEIVGRAKAGDSAGAARRLKSFARRAREIYWAGDNAADIHAEMKHGDGEPYLADMVAVTAATIHGVLGIQPTWDRLEVMPCLPAAWSRAEADVLHRGRRHRVTIEGAKSEVQALERVIDQPLVWMMDWNLRTSPAGAATTSQTEFAGVYHSELLLSRGATQGTYQSPAHNWTVPATPTKAVVAVDLRGGQAAMTVDTSDDAFRTIRSQIRVVLKDGVNTYGLQGIQGRRVRVRFELVRRAAVLDSPLIDAFSIEAAACPDLLEQAFRPPASVGPELPEDRDVAAHDAR